MFTDDRKALDIKVKQTDIQTNNKNPRIMKVDIWSDFVCPFCYIGKRKFEQALEQIDFADQLEVRWHSYQLSPGVQTDPSVTIHEYLAREKGWSVEQARRINGQVTGMAAEAGLKYDFDRAIPANTLNAHRLSHYAAEQGVQDKAEERLFSAYFTEGLNIDEIETLVKLGEEIGLDPVAVREMLDSDRFTADVTEDQNRARKIGVQGVPFFVFDNKYAISGAQPVELFVQTLQRAWEEYEKPEPLQTVTAQDGAACDPETGQCS